MKWIIATMIIVAGILLMLFFWQKGSVDTAKNILSNEITITPTISPVVEKQSKKKAILFIPYWTFGDADRFDKAYDQLVYFGVSADTNGIDTLDDGYKKLAQFIKIAEDRDKLLAIRLTNSPYNSRLLENKKLQEKIISDAVMLAKLHDFSGIVLDFELSAVAFPSVVSKTTAFYQSFSKNAHSNNLSFSSTLFGDTFYRLRAYDVAEIAFLSDEVLLMAYDLHKAGGEPGPNFPLQGKDVYGYDFQTMLSDFSKIVPKNKITVVFGMFGYDWTLDQEEKSQAIPLSLFQMTKRFVGQCIYIDCQVKRDDASLEMKAEYTDSEGKRHNVWFEDMESMQAKLKIMQKQRLFSKGFWAYSFF